MKNRPFLKNFIYREREILSKTKISRLDTVQQQYTRGPFAIASWAHLVNAHIFPGPSIITALKAAAATSLDSLRHGVSMEISVGTPTVSSDGEDDEDEDKDSEDYIEGRMRVPSSSSSSSKRKTPSWQPGTGSGIGGSNRKDSIVTNTTIYQTVSLTQQTSGSGSCSSDLSLSPSLSSPAPRPESAAMENLGEPPLARGLLLVAQMSSAGNLMDARYTEACVAAARRHRNFVLGFVAQRDLNANVSDGGGSGGSGSGDDDFVSLAPSGSDELEPGKKQTEGEGDDGLGQRYRSPREVIGRDGCDVIIVGRGIVAAKDRRKEAERYRAEAWKAYQARVG